MKTENRHTPTPWYANTPDGHAATIYGPGDAYVATCGWTRDNGVQEGKHADAEHIVLCVNLHDELVTALGALLLMSQFPPGPIAEAGIQRECAELLAKVKPKR